MLGDIMTNDFFSIIIPVKDNTIYVKPLLEHLLEQKEKYPQTEIIIVESDSTEDMSFLDNYKDITVIHEETPGLSHARNVGIDISKGNYIAFLDSDDDIVDNYMDMLYRDISDYDMCIYRWQIDDTNELGWWHTDELFFNYNVWSNTYKKELINGIYFDERLRCAEDIEWMQRVVKPTTKRKIIDEVLVKYNTKNENSLTHQVNRGELSND